MRGVLKRFTYVSAGESYVKLLNVVDANAATVRTAVCSTADPSFARHLTIVVLVHAAVKQMDEPMLTEGVRLLVAKLVPTRVILVVPELTALGFCRAETTGALYVNSCKPVPIKRALPASTDE